MDPVYFFTWGVCMRFVLWFCDRSFPLTDAVHRSAWVMYVRPSLITVFSFRPFPNCYRVVSCSIMTRESEMYLPCSALLGQAVTLCKDHHLASTCHLIYSLN